MTMKSAATKRKSVICPTTSLPLALCQEHIGRIYIRHDAIKHAWNVLRISGHRLRETSTAYIVGHSRCGKTETIKRFIQEKTGVEIKRELYGDDGRQIAVRVCEGKGTRIVFADMTNGATPRIASQMILEKGFGDVKARQSESEGAVRLVEMFTEKKINYFIVDEAQQMFRGQGTNGIIKMGSWLLPLENAAAFSTKIVGDDKVNTLLEYNVAANLRKGGYAPLAPFEFRTDKQKSAFFSFLTAFSRELPFASSCLLDGKREFKKELLFSMYFATRGIPGEMAKLCEHAAIQAAAGDPDAIVDTITIDNLADAFDFYLLYDHRMAGFNPFRKNGKDAPDIPLCNMDVKEREMERKRRIGRKGRGGQLWDD